MGAPDGVSPIQCSAYFSGFLGLEICRSPEVMNKETGVVRDIAVHNAIIAVRSTVLAAMLAHDTEESQKNCMQITDLDFDVRED